MISGNESRVSLKVKRNICLNKGEPSSKAKYGITSDSERVTWVNDKEVVILQGYLITTEIKS